MIIKGLLLITTHRLEDDDWDAMKDGLAYRFDATARNQDLGCGEVLFKVGAGFVHTDEAIGRIEMPHVIGENIERDVWVVGDELDNRPAMVRVSDIHEACFAADPPDKRRRVNERWDIVVDKVGGLGVRHIAWCQTNRTIQVHRSF